MQQKLCSEESTNIVPLHLRFHLGVWLPDSEEYHDNSAYLRNMTRQIALVPLVFLPHNNSNLHTISKNDKNRNKFLSRLGR